MIDVWESANQRLPQCYRGIGIDQKEWREGRLMSGMVAVSSTEHCLIFTN